MTTDRVDCVVIGAGVVGMAAARALAQAGHEVIVLEAAEQPGTEISARNSGVIHAGIYYPTGSLKAELCRRGKEMLYAYCASHGVVHKRCGKLIVATKPEEEAALSRIKALAEANGVNDLTPLSREEALALEPELNATAALLSPSTGLVDVHGLILALQGDLEEGGGMVALNTPVTGGCINQDGILLRTGGEAPMDLRAGLVVNAAGLGAIALAAKLENFPQGHLPRLYTAKGNYFSLTGKAPFSHLIYPVPEKAGLGVHVTLDLDGQVRFGPDVEWTEDLDYQVDPARAEPFYAAIRRYWPALPDGALAPAFAGIRPKLQAPGEPAADFIIQGPETHGVPGLVNLFGIESPGLTSCLAIGERVAQAVL